MTSSETLAAEQAPSTSKRMRLTAVHLTGLTARGRILYERQLVLNGLDVEVMRVDTDMEIDLSDPATIPRQWAVVTPLAIGEALAIAGQKDEGAFWSGYHYAEILQDDDRDVTKIADWLSESGLRDAANFWYGRAAAEDVTEASQQIPPSEIHIPLTAGRLYETPASLDE